MGTLVSRSKAAVTTSLPLWWDIVGAYGSGRGGAEEGFRRLSVDLQVRPTARRWVVHHPTMIAVCCMLLHAAYIVDSAFEALTATFRYSARAGTGLPWYCCTNVPWCCWKHVKVAYYSTDDCIGVMGGTVILCGSMVGRFESSDARWVCPPRRLVLIGSS